MEFEKSDIIIYRGGRFEIEFYSGGTYRVRAISNDEIWYLHSNIHDEIKIDTKYVRKQKLIRLLDV